MARGVLTAVAAAVGLSGFQAAQAVVIQKHQTLKESAAADPESFWPGKNGGALRTGSTVAVAPSGDAITKGPTWSFHEELPDDYLKDHPDHLEKYPGLKGLVRSTPLIDSEKNIYLATVTFGKIYKFTAHGEKLWHFDARGHFKNEAQIPDIPVLMDGKLFAATNFGDVFALDMKTGEVLWNTKLNPVAGDTWSLAAGEGTIVTADVKDQSAHGNNNRLTGLRASDGQKLWTFDLEPTVTIFNILVSIKNASCVFSTSTGKVYRLALDTGKVIWHTEHPVFRSFSTGGAILGPDGNVYFTWNEYVVDEKTERASEHVEGLLGALDFKTGEELWTTELELQAGNAPAAGYLANGSLALVIGIGENPKMPDPSKGIKDDMGPAMQQRVVALDAKTGEYFWQYVLPDWHGSALGDDHRPDICLPDAFGNAAIGGDGTAYISHASGYLFSLNDKNGDGVIGEGEVAQWQQGAASQGSPGIAPGMVVATPCNGMHVWLNEPSTP